MARSTSPASMAAEDSARLVSGARTMRTRSFSASLTLAKVAKKWAISLPAGATARRRVIGDR
jgi:hypothetical protein